MTGTGAADPLHLLALARVEFARRLPGVVGRLDLPTPCSGWNVRDLLQHVVVGNRVTVVTLQGASRDDVVATRDALAAADVLGDDPVAAFAGSADAQAAAFAEPGALERICHHGLGDIAGAQVLPFRVGDLTLHAWDLARALAVDETLDPVLVRYVYDTMAPAADRLATSGWYGTGASGTVSDDAPLQHVLLDLSGRRP
jgi:uncharacterized protein (TIGR03086 family)